MTRPQESDPSRLRRWAAHPAGPAVLVLFALVEATFFPAPTEALLLALVLVRPGRAWRLGTLATVASAAGGLLGYAMGAQLAGVGGGLEALQAEEGLVAAVAGLYRDNLALALASSGFTPIPFFAYTTAAGALQLPVFPFLLFTLLGRGLKFAVVAGLAHWIGPQLWEEGGDRWIAFGVVAALVVWFVLRTLLA